MSRYFTVERLRNILEVPMLNEVNKDNPNAVSSLLYFVPASRLF